MVTAKLKEAAEHVIAMLILLLNTRRAQSALLLLICWIANLLQPCTRPNEKRYLFSRHYLTHHSGVIKQIGAASEDAAPLVITIVKILT